MLQLEREPKMVIFDCDGVVVDSEPLTLQLIRDDLAARGLPLELPKVTDLFVGGTIAGAINIPFGEVDLRHDELLKMKDLPIVLICAMGRNAGLAGEKLQKHGYLETHVLKGGLATWQQEGLPLVKV